MHEIQEEIFTQAKFFGKILTKDAVCCFILFQVATGLQERTYGPLATISFFFVIIMGVYWLLPSSLTRNSLRNYQRLWIILTNNRQAYHPLAQQQFQVEEDLSMAMFTEEELAEEDKIIEEEMKEYN
ncbi:hypothetical protein C6N01_13010 [Enterococcus faecalis]|uniref:DUF5592 family protein n=1 Tax=Enterococcus TaxID=1350 RepID=UPI001363DB2C|nr:DUF5592 family protein [Enterococcus faecalis]NBJ47127.1 hypothetical protein [Enterococcus faecalis]